MSFSQQEASFQKLYDVAVKLLEASHTNEKNAADAIKELSQASIRVERSSDQLKREVVSIVTAMADTTANKAVSLLTQNFKDADAAAERAESRYEAAGGWLTFKLLGYSSTLLIVLMIVGWFIIDRTQPSQANIDSRRQTIEELSKEETNLRRKINDLQRDVNGMSRKVKELERRGGRIEVTDCTLNEQTSAPCVRTEESEQSNSWGGNEGVNNFV